MKLDPLAEMHLLLREHGWKPEQEHLPELVWDWRHPAQPPDSGFTTWPGGMWAYYVDDEEPCDGYHKSVEKLRSRLKELATGKG
jgi:hypothetical protein